MADAVQFLILPGILMLLHHAVHIVVNGTAGYDTSLAPAIHGEFIEIVIFLRVRHIDPFLNLTIKQLPGLVIDTAVIGVHVIPKLSLSPVNVQEGKGIPLNGLTGLLPVIHIIGQGRYPGRLVRRGPDTHKWFYYCHRFSPVYPECV